MFHGFAFNPQRPLVKDYRVRRALSRLYPFAWTNQNIFAGDLTASTSYFSNSGMAHDEVVSAAEHALLDRFANRLPPQVFESNPSPVQLNDPMDRGVLRQAVDELAEAGWRINRLTQRMENSEGQPLTLLLLTVDGPKIDRLTRVYHEILARLGIDLELRILDSSAYQPAVDAK